MKTPRKIAEEIVALGLGAQRIHKSTRIRIEAAIREARAAGYFEHRDNPGRMPFDVGVELGCVDEITRGIYERTP